MPIPYAPVARVLAGAALLAAAAACADDRVPVPLDTAQAVGGNASSPVATPQDNPLADGANRPGATAPVSDATTMAQVDTVIITASRGLTAIPTNIAIPLIQRLEERLDDTDVEPLDQIADGLEDLREELEKQPVDGKRVGTILIDVGNRTSAVGASQQIAGAGGPKITQLGELLTEAGRQLGGTIAGRTVAPR
jgi:hypothetical protein